MTGRWLDHTVTDEEAGRTVQDVLTGPMQVSRRMIQKLTRAQGILLNRRAPFLGRKVKAGDVVSARIQRDEEPGLLPVEMPLDIVYEDGDVLVLNKPPGVLVHPTSPEQRETLAHGVAFHFAQRDLRARVRPVHRIDRDTSGLVLFANSAMAHQLLDKQLREGVIGRAYLALVDGVMEGDQGVIDAPIGRDPRRPNLRAVRPNTEPARTRWRVIDRFPNATLLELELETGRTHQIRVHMQHAGHPVLGDRQYGRAGVRLIGRQALHASRLTFHHPTSGQEMTFEAPLPDDMARAVDQLRGGGGDGAAEASTGG
ncbi:MAG TPA: RluA family pseudouridine synthase [Longimicrobium sp.]|nr:RluA family pseudouridine synthase [Longimicrobium sp.]